MLLPIVFLVIFEAIFKGTTIVDGRTIKLTTFYVPGIMTLGIISACYVEPHPGRRHPARERRAQALRGTPLPASFVIASRTGVGVVVAIVMSALLLVIGVVAYGVRGSAGDARAHTRGGRRSRRVRVHRVRGLDPHPRRRLSCARRPT